MPPGYLLLYRLIPNTSRNCPMSDMGNFYFQCQPRRKYIPKRRNSLSPTRRCADAAGQYTISKNATDCMYTVHTCRNPIQLVNPVGNQTEQLPSMHIGRGLYPAGKLDCKRFFCTMERPGAEVLLAIITNRINYDIFVLRCCCVPSRPSQDVAMFRRVLLKGHIPGSR